MYSDYYSGVVKHLLTLLQTKLIVSHRVQLGSKYHNLKKPNKIILSSYQNTVYWSGLTEIRCSAAK